MYDADPSHEIDFDTMPIQLEQMKDRTALQVKVTELFVADLFDPATNNCRNVYSGVIHDYCCVAQRKTKAGRFRYPMQRYYWQAGHTSPRWMTSLTDVRAVRFVRKVADLVQERGVRWFLGAVSKRVVRDIAAIISMFRGSARRVDASRCARWERRHTVLA
jgi:hypothetical protein